MKKQPIGIFDSGVGGLTVFKEIRKQFPKEDIVYFGDTARVPYGPKSKNTVIEYSIQNTRFLIQQNAKLIVIACNTSSSVAINVLREMFDVPVIGVIEPGAESAIRKTENYKIGVIGTDGTVNSNAYQNAIKTMKLESEVYSQACPLFVSLAEEGWENHQAAHIVAKEYLSSLLKHDIDTLVLGCTHFPILKETIQQTVGEKIQLVDSAIAVAEKLKSLISEDKSSLYGEDHFYVSDNEEKFRKIASKILEKNVETLEKVNLGESWYITH